MLEDAVDNANRSQGTLLNSVLSSEMLWTWGGSAAVTVGATREAAESEVCCKTGAAHLLCLPCHLGGHLLSIFSAPRPLPHDAFSHSQEAGEG